MLSGRNGSKLLRKLRCGWLPLRRWVCLWNCLGNSQLEGGFPLSELKSTSPDPSSALNAMLNKSSLAHFEDICSLAGSSLLWAVSHSFLYLEEFLSLWDLVGS